MLLKEDSPGYARGLAVKPHSGHKNRPTAERLAELEALLLHRATWRGWPIAFWSAQEVAEVIRRHFHLKLSRRSLMVDVAFAD